MNDHHRASERHEHLELGTEESLYEEEDVVARRENEIGRINGIIWLILAVIESFIGLRVILKALAANPQNPFADFIYRISRLFLMPFFGLVGEPVSDGSVLEISSIIGGVVYLLVFWGITRVVNLILMPSRVRHLRTIQRH